MQLVLCFYVAKKRYNNSTRSTQKKNNTCNLNRPLLSKDALQTKENERGHRSTTDS